MEKSKLMVEEAYEASTEHSPFMRLLQAPVKVNEALGTIPAPAASPALQELLAKPIGVPRGPRGRLTVVCRSCGKIGYACSPVMIVVLDGSDDGVELNQD